MEIIIEFIVTLLVELFFDGSIDIFTNKRVSMPLRVLVFTVFVMVMGSFFWLFFWIALNANLLLGILLFLFELFLMGCIIYAVRKRILRRRDHEERDEGADNKEDI